MATNNDANTGRLTSHVIAHARFKFWSDKEESLFLAPILNFHSGGKSNNNKRISSKPQVWKEKEVRFLNPN